MDIEGFILRLAIGLPGFLLAIVFHEVAHAYVASRFGDNTAMMSGRFTLNPAAHVDPLGTFVLPLIGAALGGVMFGWAKPVPVDSRRFKEYRKGMFWVSFAGPLANLILAVISAVVFALVVTKVSPQFYFYEVFSQMLKQAIMINIVLGMFNLIPFPPLDGSKMVSSFLDFEQARKYEQLQQFSLLFILLIWTTPILNYVIGPVMRMGYVLMNTLVYMFS